MIIAKVSQKLYYDFIAKHVASVCLILSAVGIAKHSFHEA